MEGLVFKHWIEETKKYKDYDINMEIYDIIGINLIVNNKWFTWRKFYRWEDIKPYTLRELLNKFIAEFNFQQEEYKRRIDNGKE